MPQSANVQQRPIRGGHREPVVVTNDTAQGDVSIPVQITNTPIGVDVETLPAGGFLNDFFLEVARGNVSGMTHINKFGRAIDGVQTSLTDIWDRADSSATQNIWVAPTAARIHTIASTSAQDNTGGTGANSVEIFYLPDWNTAQASETVTGNLNAGIAMTNAAVIIHRMRVIPQATSTSANVGTITATAAAPDSTITAQINALEGQTQMAIYGIPSTQTLYLNRYYGSVHDPSNPATAYRADILLKVNPNPNIQLVSFLIKNTNGLVSNGAGFVSQNFTPQFVIPGPAIVKIQMIGSSADGDASAGFDGILINN